MATHDEPTSVPTETSRALLRALADLCTVQPAAFAWVVRRATRFQHEGQGRDEAYWAALAEINIHPPVRLD